jgi:uncharacterized protein
MMQGLALSPEAPLYGRAKQLFKLEPLAPGYIIKALGHGDARQAIRAYATWGGIPRYWELAAQFPDLRSAVDALVLDPMGVLHDEPMRLLLEETPPAIALRSLLDVIGAGAHRVSEIAGRVGQPATSLSRPLTRLQELDLVVRETPFGETDRATKRALYKLANPFLSLWFSLVAPQRSALAHLPRAGRLRLLDAALPRLVSAAWESLCRRAVPKLADRLGVEYGPAARSWSAAGPEWDVVARAVSGGPLLLGEVKWTDAAVTASSVNRAIHHLIAKGVPRLRPTEPEPRYAVFIPERPKGKLATAPNVKLIDAREVLEALR